MSSKGRKNIEAMCASIQKSIDEGTPRLPWTKPWGLVGHKSVKTGHVYQGGNGLICAIMANDFNLGPAWGTYKQLVGVTGKGKTAVDGLIRKLGGSLKGESAMAYLARPIFKDTTNPDTGRQERKLVAFSHFAVFNVDQVHLGPVMGETGEAGSHESAHRLARIRLDAAKAELSKTTTRQARPMAEINDVLRPFEASLLGGITFTGTGNSAHYSPLRDSIQVPEQGRFDSDAAFYSTRFHECAHATGAASRLGRFKASDFASRDRYSAEELVAEFAAAYLRAEFGIEGGTEQSMSESYIRGWAEKLSSMDDQTLYKAMGQAVKAAEWVLCGDPALRPEDDEQGASAAQEAASQSK